MLSVFQIKGPIQKEIKSVDIKTCEENSTLGPTSCLRMLITKPFERAQEI